MSGGCARRLLADHRIRTEEGSEVRQLTFISPGKLEWQEVREPTITGSNQALVRPLAVARCDLDLLIVRGGAPFRGPFAFGHECVGEIVELSDDVAHLQVGDVVAVSFEIACGTCVRCSRGLTSSCDNVATPAMYGFGTVGGDWGGALSDLLHVPFASSMLVPLPEDADVVAYASAGDNICDGWRTVVPHVGRERNSVLVVGGGAQSIGLYAVDAARAAGVERIVYVDKSRSRLEVAASLGAEAIERVDPSQGAFAIAVDASADPSGLRAALEALEPGGICTSVGIYYEDVALPLLEMYRLGTTLTTGRCNACHHLREVVTAIRDERLHPERVTSRIVPWEEAIDAMDDPGPKLVVVRDE